MVAVAHIVNVLGLGGAERVAVNLANGFSADDCRAHVIATRSTGPLRDLLLPEVGFYSAERRVRLDWPALRRLGRYIDENEIQVLHAHDRSTVVVLRLATLFAKRKPLHILHDHAGQEINDPRVALFSRIFLRNLAGHISVTDALHKRAQTLLPLPSGRCIWMPNGITISPPHDPFEGPPTVIQVANLQWPKGHRTAMRCADLVRKEIPDLRWRCVGRIVEDMEYVKNVRGQIAELDLEGCVELLGERTDVQDLVYKAHVGVVTSDLEGLPLAVLEYMSECLPVVATRVGQVPALVAASKGGRIVPVGDAKALATEIVTLLRNESLRREMGAAGRQHVCDHFSVETMVQQTKEFYCEIFAERGLSAPKSWTEA